MKLNVIVVVASVCAIFSGCTSLKTDMTNVGNLSTNLTQICQTNEVKQLSSPTEILDGLKTNLETELGFSSDPKDAPSKTNIQQTLDDLKSQFGKLEAADQQSVATIKASIDTLKTDVTTVRNDLETKFSTWAKTEKSECKANPLGCVIPTVLTVQQLGQTIEDDASTLQLDAQTAKAAIQTQLLVLAAKGGQGSTESTIAANIGDDFQKLETMAGVLKRFIDVMINLPNTPDKPPVGPAPAPAQDPIAIAIKQTLEMSFDDYLAYVAAYETENLATQAARDAIAKLDTLSAQTWGIPAYLASGLIGLGAYDEARSGIKEFAKKARDSKIAGHPSFEAAYYQALVAQSCSRMGQDAGTADTNSTRAQILLEPIHIMLICNDNDIASDGSIKSCLGIAVAEPPPSTDSTAPAQTAHSKPVKVVPAAVAQTPPAVPTMSTLSAAAHPVAEIVSAQLTTIALASPSNQSAGQTKQIFSMIYRTAECAAGNAYAASCPQPDGSFPSKFYLKGRGPKPEALLGEQPHPTILSLKPQTYAFVPDTTLSAATSSFKWPPVPAAAKQ